MIISSCPLRISLVGGSTDNPRFIEKYNTGAVISFPSNLRTYTVIHQDVFGANSLDHNYVINYSKQESVKNICDIQNTLIRHCFKYLNVDKIHCTLTSDIYSTGSGLAASSAYLLSLIKAIYELNNKSISEFEVCKIAEEIEKDFNPLVGQQDFYGSIGGLKKISFYKNEDPSIKFLSTSIFNYMDIFLIYTGIVRNSTQIIETIDIDKSLILLNDVIDLEESIKTCNISKFNEVINRSWENKKNTSNYICENKSLVELDKKIKEDDDILSHKLCGAGNGGYFLIFTNKNKEDEIYLKYKNVKKIEISESGIKLNKI